MAAKLLAPSQYAPRSRGATRGAPDCGQASAPRALFHRRLTSPAHHAACSLPMLTNRTLAPFGADVRWSPIKRLAAQIWLICLSRLVGTCTAASRSDSAFCSTVCFDSPGRESAGQRRHDDLGSTRPRRPSGRAPADPVAPLAATAPVSSRPHSILAARCGPPEVRRPRGARQICGDGGR
jgi:hypothetical protein